jgi:hypothetical protein
MMRGTFANVRLRNQMAPGTEGGVTTYQPGGDAMTIYDASVKYQEAGVPGFLGHEPTMGTETSEFNRIRSPIIARDIRSTPGALRRETCRADLVIRYDTRMFWEGALDDGPG